MSIQQTWRCSYDPNCERVFSSEGALRNHKRDHNSQITVTHVSGDKVTAIRNQNHCLECPCGSTFRDESDARRHVQSCKNLPGNRIPSNSIDDNGQT